MKRIVVDGVALTASPAHRFVDTYPRRCVAANTDVGWNRCERCTEEHRVWMTDDRIWRRLPRRWRRAQLCTRCFRALAPERRRSR